MSTSYINNNGEILENNGATIIAGNRGYLYGDGIFESIRIKNGRVVNINAHISRMLEGAKALKIRVPNFYSVEFFKEKIEELLQHSSINDGGRVRLSLERAHGGTYKPETNESHYFIEVYPLALVLRQKRCRVGFEHKVPHRG
ncbi:MAG: aminotransferase class IV [Lishizhenia sp.]